VVVGSDFYVRLIVACWDELSRRGVLFDRRFDRLVRGPVTVLQLLHLRERTVAEAEAETAPTPGLGRFLDVASEVRVHCPDFVNDASLKALLVYRLVRRRAADGQLEMRLEVPWTWHHHVVLRRALRDAAGATGDVFTETSAALRLPALDA
jgi:hypothetical protein